MTSHARAQSLATTHKVKASDLISLRKSLGEHQLQQIRERMPPALRAVFDTTVATAWMPEPQICAIYAHVCAIMFPATLSPHVALGHHMALMAYRGVYRVFLSIPSTTYVVKKAASVWASYHSTGTATMEDVSDHGAVLLVSNAAPISHAMIDIISGHTMALVELTGGKQPLVVSNVEDPSALRWSIRWK